MAVIVVSSDVDTFFSGELQIGASESELKALKSRTRTMVIGQDGSIVYLLQENMHKRFMSEARFCSGEMMPRHFSDFFIESNSLSVEGWFDIACIIARAIESRTLSDYTT